MLDELDRLVHRDLPEGIRARVHTARAHPTAILEHEYIAFEGRWVPLFAPPAPFRSEYPATALRPDYSSEHTKRILMTRTPLDLRRAARAHYYPAYRQESSP